MNDHLTFDGLVTPHDAYRRFVINGESIAAWAVEHGFNPSLVYLVLRGKRKCLRGQSHKIAIRLGIKADAGMICEDEASPGAIGASAPTNKGLGNAWLRIEPREVDPGQRSPIKAPIEGQT